jgi:N-acetylmuramic acid 6-phosphate etherase
MTSEPPPTERRNPATVAIDLEPSLSAVRALLAEDATGVAAATAAADQIAAAVDRAHARLALGGEVHYFGAGASGRIAMLDASEITPTFGVPAGTFLAHFPGGLEAITDSTIDEEDAESAGFDDAADLNAASVAVGVTASGSTPYVAGALRRAKDVGALTVLVTCNPTAPLRTLADIAVIADTGPEALTGSTRLKAGTATKVILNAFSTVLMIRAGRVYSNLMVGMIPSNDKLRDRAVRILAELTSAPVSDCEHALAAADDNVAVALISLLTGCSAAAGGDALSKAGGVRRAIGLISSEAVT